MTREELNGELGESKFRESGKFDDRGWRTTVRSSRATAYSRQFDSGRDTSPAVEYALVSGLIAPRRPDDPTSMPRRLFNVEN